MATIKKAALRYFGSKWRLSDWIISYFVEHVAFIDVYGGSASITLHKPPSEIEVYNDIDGDVVNFFEIVRDHCEDFIRAIELTPYSRRELTKAYEPTSDPLEKARRFYIRSRQSRGGPTTQKR